MKYRCGYRREKSDCTTATCWLAKLLALLNGGHDGRIHQAGPGRLATRVDFCIRNEFARWKINERAYQSKQYVVCDTFTKHIPKSSNDTLNSPHRSTPKDHTSDLMVQEPSKKLSGAIQRMGSAQGLLDEDR